MVGATTAEAIREKALELGYDDCGIVRVEEVADYADSLARRIERFPHSKPMYERFYGYAQPAERYPWARSVVVCASWYGKYRIPEKMQGRIGKSFLADVRREPRAAAYQNSLRFEEWMRERGLQTLAERDYGITALRWVAARAGLGAIRKNNFFYTERGSWVWLEAWLTDADLELKKTSPVKNCPESCSRCVQSCPTAALAEPFAMDGTSCVCFLTAIRGCLPGAPHNDEIGDWIYGCDACQDACPFNSRAWKAEEDFPGLEELSEQLSPERILDMDYETLRALLPPKFFYIREKDVWKWKVNVLNALRNRCEERWRPAVERARRDENENVRTMAERVPAECGQT